MIHYSTRIASLVLAFGFFISCSTLQSPTSKSSSSSALSEQQIQQQIDSLNKRINSNGPSAELLLQKGKLLTKLAQNKPPSERSIPYSNAYQTLAEAADLFKKSSDSKSEKVKELLNVTWSIEHNKGIEILQSDPSSNPDYVRAAAHFNNATIVIPDSAISYQMQARAFYKNQQPQKAINVLEKAQKRASQIPPLLLEQLAFLYLENDAPKKAVKIYEQAESFSDQNLNLLHGLSNAYINSGNHKQAAELLQQLVETKPNNIIYGQTFATELYFVASQQLDTVISNLRGTQRLGETKFHQADSLLQKSESEFQRILAENSENQDLKLRLAKFYHNSASKYQQMMPYVEQQNKQQLETKIKEYLSSSIPLLEQLAENSPDEQGIWQNLYQAYSYLGMESEAQKAKSNL